MIDIIGLFLEKSCYLNQTFPRILYTVGGNGALLLIPLILFASFSLPLDFPLRRTLLIHIEYTRGTFFPLCRAVSHSLLWTMKLYKKANHNRHDINVKLHFSNVSPVVVGQDSAKTKEKVNLKCHSVSSTRK